MIVQTFVVILTLSVALISDVNGTSFSNVYVESEVAPLGYYSYGTPYTSIANPRLSQINSLPTVHGYVGPCVSPCVYPAQTVATVTPMNPSPNVLTYNAPSAPVIVAPTKQEATGYEYSYVVYDQNTGDHKAQRELSDGSVVRGEYSFLQPDGYIREVQYVADDVTGFNAVVKNFLPVAEESNKKGTGTENKDSPPCQEIKNESLKEGSEENSGESSVKQLEKIHDNLHRKQFNEKSAEQSKEHHQSNQSEEEENSKEKHHKATKKASKEETGEESVVESNKDRSMNPKHPKEASGEKSEENTKEKQDINPDHSKEENYNKTKESAGESKERQNKNTKKESKDSEEEFESEDSKEELKEKTRKKSSKDTEVSKNRSKKVSKESSGEDSGEESDEVGSGKHKEAHELLKPSTEVVVPYKDILRCIEAAMKRNYGVPAAMRQEPSPLTYIVLNQPC